jgi:MoaA/NifB/PqqE/SkfB family radical SAM enzyme
MTTCTIRECWQVVNIPFATLEVTGKCNSRCKTCNVWKLQADQDAGRRELDRGKMGGGMGTATYFSPR